ncbi:MAG: TetR family transcriptional regulator [Clostridia bacterium]|nr:TetR family transcriptional regulator [Clostridia bacterium]
MPKGSPELTKSRRSEIMEASIRLYDERIFKDITMKDIAESITFARSNIYNYFQTREEIFLGIFEQEYRKWNRDLEQIANEHIADKNLLADLLAKSLEKRKLMLKLLAVNLYDLEENCRIECLISFKKVYAVSRSHMLEIIKNCHPNLSDEQLLQKMLAVLAYLHGIYPYCYATEKQSAAMKSAGIEAKAQKIYDLAYAGLKELI